MEIVALYLLLQVPIYGSFRNAFHGVRSVLINKLDISHGLIDSLCRHDVITDLHVSDIRVCISLNNLWILCVFLRSGCYAVVVAF